MSEASEYADRAVVDIETSVIPNVESFLGDVKAPANYRSEEAIKGYLEKATTKEREKASLDPDLCRIVAIAYQDVGQGIDLNPVGWIARNEEDERRMLTAFWKRAKSKLGGHKTLIGFNINDFDVPVLMRRSLYLGVPFLQYEVGKYRHPKVVDLMQILSMDGKLNYRSKDWYCRRFGIRVDGDPLESGRDVMEAIVTGDYDAVLAHAKIDVRKEYLLAEKVGVL